MFKITTPEGNLVYGNVEMDSLDRAVAIARQLRLPGEPLQIRQAGEIVATLSEHGKLEVK